MSEQQFSISLCRDDDEVAVFNAQPDNNDSVNNTLSDYEFEAATAYFSDGVAADTYKQLEEVQSHPPAQLLEDDPEVSTSEQVNIQILEGLNAKHRSVKEQFENELEIVREVSRHNCVNDMLTLFRQQSVADSKLCLLFKGEHAVGSGVLREVYSVFWDSFVSSYCEGSSHFTFSVTAAMSQDDFVAVGLILTHQFIETGTLPLQIEEAIIQQAVTGWVSEECLVQSLLMLLHEKEREILQQALLGVKPFPTEDVIDILADYGITAIPCTSNMKQLILQVSEAELISKPFMCITKLREGMGSFWDGVNADEIHAVTIIVVQPIATY